MVETDHKYNHWIALQYILSRHFMNCTIDSVPIFYKNIVEMVNNKKDNNCKELINKLLEMLPKEIEYLIKN